MSGMFPESGIASIVQLPDGKRRVSFPGGHFTPDKLLGVSKFPGCPPAYFAPIGAIIVQWGTFEDNHNRLLFALVDYNNSDRSTVPQSFSRRRDRFKVEAKSAFSACPHIREYFSHWLGEAAALYPDRNLLSHGHIGFTARLNSMDEPVSEQQLDLSIMARGERLGAPVSKSFTMLDLETLYYRIARLAGAIHELETENPRIPGLTPLENSALQAFQVKTRLVPFPSTNTPPADGEPSRE